MMAVDTSALIAIVLREAEADRCKAALEEEADLLISAGTVAEAFDRGRPPQSRRGDESADRWPWLRHRVGNTGLGTPDRYILRAMG